MDRDTVTDLGVPKRALAQEKDQMWERNLSIIASKNREVEVITTYEEELIGFIAGLDEQFVQVCLSKSAVQVLVNRNHLIQIQETGKDLSDIKDDTLKRRVEDRVKMFSTVSKSFASNH